MDPNKEDAQVRARRRILRSEQLLRIVLDKPGTPSERQPAYRRVLSEPVCLIELDATTREAIEAGIQTGILDIPPPQPADARPTLPAYDVLQR